MDLCTATDAAVNTFKPKSCSSYCAQIHLLWYWIYLLPSTQQTIGCNGFFTTTCFDSHESSSGYVQNLLVLSLLLLTVLEVVGRYEVVAVLTLIWMTFWKHISRNVTGNYLIFIIMILNIKQFLVTFLDICFQNVIHISVRTATTSYRPTPSRTVSNNSTKTKRFWT
jgi:hypothetical protein